MLSSLPAVQRGLSWQPNWPSRCTPELDWTEQKPKMLVSCRYLLFDAWDDVYQMNKLNGRRWWLHKIWIIMTQHCNTKNEAIRLFDYFFVCGLPESEPPSFFKQYEDSSSPGMVHTIRAWKFILIYIYMVGAKTLVQQMHFGFVANMLGLWWLITR